MMRTALLVAGGALLGLTWGNGPVMAAAVLLPLLWGAAPARWCAGAIALAYYLAASRGLPLGAGIFFEATAPAWFGWALWCTAASANALPWVLLWRLDARKRAFGAPAALILTAIPPLGLLGWTNPLTAAGLLFPGMGFAGFALVILAAFFLARRDRAATAILAGAALVANICAFAWPSTPAPAREWVARDTAFRQLQSGSASNLPQRLQLVIELAQAAKPGQVIVLPETILPARDPRLAFMGALLDDAAETLASKGAVILVGTELAVPGQDRQNVLVALGEGSAPLAQRVPVPIGMWRPWAADSYQANLGGAGIAAVAGQRVAYSICYEQLLVFTTLRSMASRPSVIVGAANDWWARDTSIPAIQEQTLDAWGRLFAIPVLQATNI
jgi:hypothetical protein